MSRLQFEGWIGERSHCNFSPKLNSQLTNCDRTFGDGVDLGDRILRNCVK
ncbi:hypothetical protein H6G81_06655 [Scytonema hofmannii FACHB-248]|uniref:Uncharacterized protein n=1 Tax=Scytonema hofmannii FACHB-248 TaxID=1842502 RepID=A0ABR8GLE2_9CYAN|nr:MULTISPECIES: hypothetical protein [Nostocales]MBD2604217.1 hypothetical protein [Scytonema hofmannii FACHB-248]